MQVLRYSLLLLIVGLLVYHWGKTTPISNLNTLQRLKDNEKFTIEYRSDGCFHGYSRKMILQRPSGRIEARLYKDSVAYHQEGSMVSIQVVKDVQVKTKLLTPADSLAYLRFEKELEEIRKMHSGSCTTRDVYTISSKYRHEQIADGHCAWNGFSNLVTTWFGKTAF